VANGFEKGQKKNCVVLQALPTFAAPKSSFIHFGSPANAGRLNQKNFKKWQKKSQAM
jgi:hypothetical protein